MRSAILAVIAFAVAQPAFGKAPPQPPEPAVHPDWAAAADAGVSALKLTLFDPGSAQFRWVSGFRWGFMKPLIGKRTFGWVACGNVNAKNRMGGYVGEEGFSLFVTPDGNVQVAMRGQVVSSCDDGVRIAVNPELAASTQTASSPPPTMSVADEIKKLADLRASGVLTDEEFQTQKAKLLGQ